MKLYTSKETKKIDNLAIREKEISGYSLMQRAAEFALDVILKEFGPLEELVIFYILVIYYLVYIFFYNR